MGTTGATFTATVNPNGRATSWDFQYATQAAFEAEGFAGAQSVPAPEGQLPLGTADVEVSAVALGLQSGTAYRVRAVATNSFSPPGGTAGSASGFATYAPPLAGLPDLRAYEQASPIVKNGQGAGGIVSNVRTSPEGDAISFVTTNGIPGAEGLQNIPTWLASRGPASWSTVGLLPAANPLIPKANLIGWKRDFSLAFNAVTDPGGGALLAREAARGAEHTILPYGQLDPEAVEAISYAGSGGSLSLFESKTAIPSVPGALEGAPNVYAWD